MTRNLEEEIERSLKIDSRLKVEEVKLKKELFVLNDSVIDTNNYLLEQYLPLLKGLHKVVKEQASLQKEENFRV